MGDKLHSWNRRKLPARNEMEARINCPYCDELLDVKVDGDALILACYDPTIPPSKAKMRENRSGGG
jgi:hypothetical protein